MWVGSGARIGRNLGSVRFMIYRGPLLFGHALVFVSGYAFSHLSMHTNTILQL